VGSEAIYERDVDRWHERISRGQTIDPSILPVVRAQALAEIVNRRLVLAYARRTRTAPTDAEIDKALGDLEAILIAQGRSVDEYLSGASATESDLRRQIAWNLTWERYLARYVTEDRLSAYFQARRRDFDGTEVSVRHILLRGDKGSLPAQMDRLVSRAREIRDRILAGDVSFDEAARDYSEGASRETGGQLGWMTRHGSMDEAFSRAAFALQPGEVSEPVVTRFGVHLIRLEQIRPGDKQLEDVRDKLSGSLARELLEKIAQSESGFTPVKFAPAVPHFNPGTREFIDASLVPSQ
jgi:parvulin-like peptidyl-prolyl isomerase